MLQILTLTANISRMQGPQDFSSGILAYHYNLYSGVARVFLRASIVCKLRAKRVHKIFTATPPSITSACAMALDLDIKTQSYRL